MSYGHHEGTCGILRTGSRQSRTFFLIDPVVYFTQVNLLESISWVPQWRYKEIEGESEQSQSNSRVYSVPA